jgi:hypothetical protein
MITRNNEIDRRKKNGIAFDDLLPSGLRVRSRHCPMLSSRNKGAVTNPRRREQRRRRLRSRAGRPAKARRTLCLGDPRRPATATLPSAACPPGTPTTTRPTATCRPLPRPAASHPRRPETRRPRRSGSCRRSGARFSAAGRRPRRATCERRGHRPRTSSLAGLVGRRGRPPESRRS